MTKPQVGLNEIKEFLLSFQINSDAQDFSSQTAFRIYRRFHSLLLWEIPVDRDEISPAVRLYLRESLADVATSYMLNFMGGYKAVRLCLRGAIENAIRTVTASSGVDVLTIPTVFKLVDECRVGWATTPTKLETLNNLYSVYGELCKTVHSTAIGYMSLRVPFEKIFQHEVTEHEKNQALLDATLKLIGDAYFIEFHELLKHIDYKNADYIRDAVEGEVKRVVTESSGIDSPGHAA